MADINRLEERVEKANEKVDKCKSTIERHKKQLDKKIKKVVKEVGIDLTGKSEEEIYELRDSYRGTDHSSAIYEVVSKFNDIDSAEKRLRDAEIVLSNWQEKLSIEVNREKFIQENAPKVIKDFLEEWKKLAHEWHIRRYNSYQDFKEKIRKERNEAIINYVESNPEHFDAYLENGKVKNYWANNLINIRGNGLESHLKKEKLDYNSIKTRRADFAGSSVLYMDTLYDEEERLTWLERTLENEKKAKLMDLILRISKVVGEIEDATYLEINEKGNLDGFVIGNKGNARVETIGAGGWNIQMFHYRTLVKSVKEIVE